MISTNDLYNCEQCHLLFHRERIGGKPGPAVIEYVRIVDPHTLQELDRIDGPARICLAVRLGKCRLIDNLAVDAGGAVG